MIYPSFDNLITTSIPFELYLLSTPEYPRFFFTSSSSALDAKYFATTDMSSALRQDIFMIYVHQSHMK